MLNNRSGTVSLLDRACFATLPSVQCGFLGNVRAEGEKVEGKIGEWQSQQQFVTTARRIPLKLITHNPRVPRGTSRLYRLFVGAGGNENRGLMQNVAIFENAGAQRSEADYPGRRAGTGGFVYCVRNITWRRRGD